MLDNTTIESRTDSLKESFLQMKVLVPEKASARASLPIAALSIEGRVPLSEEGKHLPQDHKAIKQMHEKFGTSFFFLFLFVQCVA